MLHPLIQRHQKKSSFLEKIKSVFLFIVLFSLVVRRFYPRQGNMTFRGLIALPCLLPFPLMFFTGNPFGGLSYNLGIIFSIIVYNYIKKKDHIKHISSKPIINDNN